MKAYQVTTSFYETSTETGEHTGFFRSRNFFTSKRKAISFIEDNAKLHGVTVIEKSSDVLTRFEVDALGKQYGFESGDTKLELLSYQVEPINIR